MNFRTIHVCSKLEVENKSMGWIKVPQRANASRVLSRRVLQSDDDRLRRLGSPSCRDIGDSRVGSCHLPQVLDETAWPPLPRGLAQFRKHCRRSGTGETLRRGIEAGDHRPQAHWKRNNKELVSMTTKILGWIFLLFLTGTWHKWIFHWLLLWPWRCSHDRGSCLDSWWNPCLPIPSDKVDSGNRLDARKHSWPWLHVRW